jgi:hypothetical protein
LEMEEEKIHTRTWITHHMLYSSLEPPNTDGAMHSSLSALQKIVVLIRAPLERVLCTLIVPSLFGTSYYPLPMYSPEDDFKKPSLRPHFCPRKQGASGSVKGYSWFVDYYTIIFIFYFIYGVIESSLIS